MSAAADLRESLGALGFDVVRFVRMPSDYSQPATTPPPEITALRQWLADDCQADMHWIGRGFEKRASPTLVLPNVGTIIMLGVNYCPKKNAPNDSDGFAGKPIWARYSQYSDYHDTIKPALEKAGLIIEEKLGLSPADYRYYTDTGPILERTWAARAGLGFLGKNAMLISREFGNWLFLAAILVRAKINNDDDDSSEPASRNRCGKCARCIDACPTGAIIRPGVVDSRRCISYQTIENKGIIPRGLREKIGARIYGCDVCAEACPWNRFARTTQNALLDARPEIARIPLRDLLALTPETFATHFRKTAVKRVKLAGLLRNACVVAGNMRARTDLTGVSAEEHLAQLARLATHESPLVRAHAVWAVFQIAGAGRARKLLASAFAKETDDGVLDEYGDHQTP